MASRARLVGFDELARKLATLSDRREVANALKQSVRQALAPVVRDAKTRAPVGSVPHKTYKGRLVAPGFARRSIRIVVFSDRSGQKATGLVGVRVEAFYALQFLELGTSRMAARPWLRPAFEASADPAVRQLGQGMREWIQGVAQAKIARAMNSRVRTNAGRDLKRAQALLSGLDS